MLQEKGQVTLPKEARDEMKLKPGDKIVWIRNAQNRWEVWTVDQLVEDLASSAGDLTEFLARTKKSFRPKKG